MLRATVRRYRKNLVALGELAGMGVKADLPELDNDDIALAQAGLTVRFDFDRKGWIGLDDGEASGGQQVMKSLLLLVALLRTTRRPAGSCSSTSPSPISMCQHREGRPVPPLHRAQYILTTPITHNMDVFEPADITLVTAKKPAGARWAPAIGVLQRRVEVA